MVVQRYNARETGDSLKTARKVKCGNEWAFNISQLTSSILYAKNFSLALFYGTVQDEDAHRSPISMDYCLIPAFDCHPK